MGLTLAEIAVEIGAELHGDGRIAVRALGTLKGAGPDQLAFLANPKFRSYLEQSGAAAVICTPDEVPFSPVPALAVADPYKAFALISRFFDPAPVGPTGVHPSAVVAATARVSASASIGPNAVVEEGAEIADGVRLMAGAFVGAGSRIGAGTRLWPNVTVYHGVSIGERCIIHANTVIGSDGFGFAPGRDGWTKIAQVGGVKIGSDVELGSCCSVDRGAIEDTIIADGVIIDNQVHIAHNVRIGRHSAIAGQVGIAGSVTIGENCIFAGKVGIAGHLDICDGVQVLGMTMVTRSIKKPGVYASGVPHDDHAAWRKNAVRFRQLDELFRRVKALEKSSGDKP